MLVHVIFQQDFQIASSIDADNCDYAFEIDPALVSSADYCVTWSLDGGPFVSDLTPGDITLSFDCEDNGGHYICARIFCCDNPDVFIESCSRFRSSSVIVHVTYRLL